MKRLIKQACISLLQHTYPLNRIYRHQLYLASMEGYRAARDKYLKMNAEEKRFVINSFLGDPESVISEAVVSSIELSKNEKALFALKNKHKGERCFIIATGPSLRIEDLDLLRNEICFGCNKIFLAYDRTEWRPKYYTVLDVLVAEQNAEEIKALPVTKIFPRVVSDYFESSNDILWVNGTQHLKPVFSPNIMAEVVGGYTVIYTQLQIAFYLGFSEVVLLGLDFTFAHGKPTDETCRHGKVLKGAGEINHFDPRYRPVGEKWTLPRLDQQYQHFQCAQEHFVRSGRRIINASRQTALDVFPKDQLEKILS